jgi:hypothetical protein
MLFANVNVCFCGIWFEQQLQPFFGGVESLIEIETSNIRLHEDMSSARAQVN